MKTRPILFSGPMVRALLDDRKTQTRRVVKMKSHHQIEERDDGTLWPLMYDGERDADSWMACPYGQPGDRLWVRETWQGPLLQEFEVDADPDWHTASNVHQYQSPKHCEYAADGGAKPEYTDADDVMHQGWQPSIHMPRWASRIELEVTGVRVERLQGISEADCIAEGCTKNHNGYYWGGPHKAGGLKQMATAKQAYQDLWESINGPGSWEANPWLWAVTFKRVEGGAA